MLQVSIYRYNPEADAEPRMEDFQVDTGGKDVMVLDVLEQIKAQQDSSVTYRRSCREGVCGSDGLNMNGKNGLACITPLSEVVRGDKLEVKPLPGLPVIRDLVVDMTQFYDQYEKIKPYLQNEEQAPSKERLQSPEDREKLESLQGALGSVHAQSGPLAGADFEGTIHDFQLWLAAEDRGTHSLSAEG